jgi:hypothetical protein
MPQARVTRNPGRTPPRETPMPMHGYAPDVTVRARPEHVLATTTRSARYSGSAIESDRGHFLRKI